MEHITRIASYDLGVENFAFIIEDCDVSRFKSQRDVFLSLPKKSQRKYKGEMNNEVMSILRKVCRNGQIVHLEKKSFGDGLSLYTRKIFFDFFHQSRELILSCDYHVIEQQYSNPKFGTNMKAVKICECLISWLMLNGVDIGNICLIATNAKLSVFGAPKMSKSQRKKWSVEKVKNILSHRSWDERWREIIEELKKSDDVSDCICQAQAYKYLKYVARVL